MDSTYRYAIEAALVVVLLWPYLGARAIVYRWADRHPMFVLVVLLLLATLSGTFADYGTPALFWQDSFVDQIVAGIGVATLLFVLVFLTDLLDGDLLREDVTRFLRQARGYRLPFGRRRLIWTMSWIEAGRLKAVRRYRLTVYMLLVLITFAVLTAVPTLVWEVHDILVRRPDGIHLFRGGPFYATLAWAAVILAAYVGASAGLASAPAGGPVAPTPEGPGGEPGATESEPIYRLHLIGSLILFVIFLGAPAALPARLGWLKMIVALGAFAGLAFLNRASSGRTHADEVSEPAGVPTALWRPARHRVRAAAEFILVPIGLLAAFYVLMVKFPDATVLVLYSGGTVFIHLFLVFCVGLLLFMITTEALRGPASGLLPSGTSPSLTSHGAAWRPGNATLLAVLVLLAALYIANEFPAVAVGSTLACGAGVWALLRGRPGAGARIGAVIGVVLASCVFVATASIPLVICFLLATMSLLSAATFGRPQTKMALVVAFLTLSAVCNGRYPYKYTFPALERYYDDADRVELARLHDPSSVAAAEVAMRPAPTVPATHADGRANPGHGLLGDRATLERWLEAQSRGLKPDQKPRLIVVAASGGGIAAAVWTALNLTVLEDMIPGFSRQVRVITGASGGMLGAATFVASLRNPLAPRSGELDALVAGLRRDSLTPTVRQMIFGDLFSIVLPWRQANDRGRVLEDAWIANTGGPGASPLHAAFRSLALGESEGWRPSLIVTPVLLEDGAPLVVSNLDLGFTRLHEFFKLFPPATHPGAQAMRVSTIVRMNATFPIISPAVRLPTRPGRRVIDAGYLDNYGIVTAADWINHHREWLAKHTSGVIVLQIRAYPDLQQAMGSESDPVGDGVEWLTTPIEGYTKVVSRAMLARDRSRIEGLEAWFKAQPDNPGFEWIVLECPRSAPLTWTMTDDEFASMEHLPELLRELTRFLGNPELMKQMTPEFWKLYRLQRRKTLVYPEIARNYLKNMFRLYLSLGLFADRNWADPMIQHMSEL